MFKKKIKPNEIALLIAVEGTNKYVDGLTNLADKEFGELKSYSEWLVTAVEGFKDDESSMAAIADTLSDRRYKKLKSYSEWRPRLVDELQWMVHVGGLISVEQNSNSGIAYDTLDEIIKTLEKTHKYHKGKTPYTPEYLSNLQSTLGKYLDAYLYAANNLNFNQDKKEREGLAIIHACQLIDDYSGIPLIWMFTYPLLKELVNGFNERFSQFKLIAR
jgi:hypothetical protein